jgi:hypothetical protein
METTEKKRGRPPSRQAAVDRYIDNLVDPELPGEPLRIHPARVARLTGVRADRVPTLVRARRDVVQLVAGAHLYAFVGDFKPEIISGSKPPAPPIGALPLFQFYERVNLQSYGSEGGFQPEIPWWVGAWTFISSRKRSPAETVRWMWRLFCVELARRAWDVVSVDGADERRFSGGSAREVFLVTSRLADEREDGQATDASDLLDRAAFCLSNGCHGLLRYAWGKEHEWTGAERGAWEEALEEALLPDTEEEPVGLADNDFGEGAR